MKDPESSNPGPRLTENPDGWEDERKERAEADTMPPPAFEDSEADTMPSDKPSERATIADANVSDFSLPPMTTLPAKAVTWDDRLPVHHAKEEVVRGQRNAVKEISKPENQKIPTNPGTPAALHGNADAKR